MQSMAIRSVLVAGKKRRMFGLSRIAEHQIHRVHLSLDRQHEIGNSVRMEMPRRISMSKCTPVHFRRAEPSRLPVAMGTVKTDRCWIEVRSDHDLTKSQNWI